MASAAEPTPLPGMQLVSCMLVMMTVSFQINVIWPFLPFMVDHVRGTEENAGFFVGLLASSYFVAQTPAAFLWGVLPQRFGCKRCMVFSSAAVGVSMLGFGLSESFAVGCCWRLLGGAVNGNAPVVKSYLAKITDASNQAKGFSVISFSWGLGGLVAPTLGGFLSDPVAKYPRLFVEGSLASRSFVRWPYLLPCASAAFVCFLAAAAVALWIPDDRPQARRYEQIQEDEELKPVMEQDDNETEAEGKGGEGDGSVYEAGEGAAAQHVPSYRELLDPSLCGLSCLAYLYASLNFVIFDEMLPLYCKAGYEDGGLGWDTDAIGTALSVGGLVLCFYQPLVYPTLTRRLGIVGTYTVGECSNGRLGLYCCRR